MVCTMDKISSISASIILTIYGIKKKKKKKKKKKIMIL